MLFPTQEAGGIWNSKSPFSHLNPQTSLTPAANPRLPSRMRRWSFYTSNNGYYIFETRFCISKYLPAL